MPEKWAFLRIFLFTSSFRFLIINVIWLRLDGCRRSGIWARKALFEGTYSSIREDWKQDAMAEVKKMSQSQLIKELAAATEISNKVARLFLDTFTSIAVRETKRNGVFVVPGIGRLVRVDRKARLGRNPATGESIKIPAKKVVKFRVAKSVRDAIVPPKKAK
jgi:DNA-binding protein HU-beta